MDQYDVSKKISNDEFKKMVKKASPKTRTVSNCIKAFVVGGGICIIGQAISNMLSYYDLSTGERAMGTSIILVFLASLLTGLGLYEKIGKYAGAGSIVPITGFSNSMTAPAIEFKKEGYIFGVGAKMFLIAGPVIVYGTLTSVIIGLIYYFSK